MERDEDKDSESEASGVPDLKISKYILLFNDYYTNVFYVGCY